MNEQQLLEREPERIKPGIGIEAIAAMDSEGRAKAGVLYPRIYVTSLADYNNGQWLGRWIDADQDPEDLQAEIDDLVEQSRFDGEEWGIHDFEDFGSIWLGEWESPVTIARLAHGLAKHGRPFAYWANVVGHINAAALERFEEVYQGVWESEEDYARSLIEDTGLEDQLDQTVPQGLRPYVRVDYELLARDMASDLHCVRDDQGVHVFRV